MRHATRKHAESEAAEEAADAILEAAGIEPEPAAAEKLERSGPRREPEAAEPGAASAEEEARAILAAVRKAGGLPRIAATDG